MSRALGAHRGREAAPRSWPEEMTMRRRRHALTPNEGSIHMPAPAMSVATLLDYMDDCRTMVLEEMRGMIPRDGRLGRVLYDLVFDYPLRDAKALRPALCVAESALMRSSTR